MGICWLYFMSGVIALVLIYLLILSSVFIPNNVLANVMAFMSELSKNGVVGLITLMVFVGQYVLAYHLYVFFKAKAT